MKPLFLSGPSDQVPLSCEMFLGKHLQPCLQLQLADLSLHANSRPDGPDGKYDSGGCGLRGGAHSASHRLWEL